MDSHRGPSFAVWGAFNPKAFNYNFYSVVVEKLIKWSCFSNRITFLPSSKVTDKRFIASLFGDNLQEWEYVPEQKAARGKQSCRSVVEDRTEDMCQDVELLMPREVCVLAPRALQKVINIVFASKVFEKSVKFKQNPLVMNRWSARQGWRLLSWRRSVWTSTSSCRERSAGRRRERSAGTRTGEFKRTFNAFQSGHFLELKIFLTARHPEPGSKCRDAVTQFIVFF